MSGHEFTSYFPESGSVDLEDQSTSIDAGTYAELRELASRYPQPRSALLPMLHLVQSVDGRISPRGIEACAEVLGITTAQVSGVATFYTMYKRRPAGQHHVGVCTTALCAVMGGDVLLDAAAKHLGIGPDETTPDGKISLERIECNAACDFAPVMMVNWEFMDNMTPDKAVQLLDDLQAGAEVTSTRGATITSWREAERVIAGFPDGRANEGPSAGEPSLLGLRIANKNGWTDGITASAEPKKRPRAKKPAGEETSK
jgi:NADH-quinone oxidoreductase subunit E